MPNADEKRTVHDYGWVWVPPNPPTRGHWLADDDTRVRVFPPSEGTMEFHVYVPSGPEGVEDILMRMGRDDETIVFQYATDERRGHAN